MTAYSLETSYLTDYELSDWTENTTWERPGNPGPILDTSLKGVWGDIDSPDLQGVAAGLSFVNEAAAVVVWQPKPSDEGESWRPTLDPKVGHTLRRQSRDDEGWVIRNAVEIRVGHWLIACEREVVNAN